jgi:rare lipoprotein A (peptidoglycan hydrolase)
MVVEMLRQLGRIASLLFKGQALLATVFGSSTWDAGNPNSELACYHREIDDKLDLVVAHNRLPCRLPLLLVNPRTGRSVVANVGDRGPRNADIDLSKQVAARLHHNGRERIIVVPLRPVASRWSRRVTRKKDPLRRIPSLPLTAPTIASTRSPQLPFMGVR